MRRSELLKLTGLTPARLGNLIHRQQLPFVEPGSERHGWANYTLDEAVQLSLMLALSELEWPMDRAYAAARQHYHLLLRRRDEDGASEGDLQFGVAVEVFYLPADWSAQDDWVVHGFAGTLTELAADMAEAEMTEVAGAVLVNVSAVVRRMIHRGRSKGADPERLSKLKRRWHIKGDI